MRAILEGKQLPLVAKEDSEMAFQVKARLQGFSADLPHYISVYGVEHALVVL